MRRSLKLQNILLTLGPKNLYSSKKNQYVICFVMQICLHQFDFQIVGIIRVSFLL